MTIRSIDQLVIEFEPHDTGIDTTAISLFRSSASDVVDSALSKADLTKTVSVKFSADYLANVFKYGAGADKFKEMKGKGRLFVSNLRRKDDYSPDEQQKNWSLYLTKGQLDKKIPLFNIQELNDLLDSLYNKKIMERFFLGNYDYDGRKIVPTEIIENDKILEYLMHEHRAHYNFTRLGQRKIYGDSRRIFQPENKERYVVLEMEDGYYMKIRTDALPFIAFARAQFNDAGIIDGFIKDVKLSTQHYHGFVAQNGLSGEAYKNLLGEKHSHGLLRRLEPLGAVGILPRLSGYDFADAHAKISGYYAKKEE